MSGELQDNWYSKVPEYILPKALSYLYISYLTYPTYLVGTSPSIVNIQGRANL